MCKLWWLLVTVFTHFLQEYQDRAYTCTTFLFTFFFIFLEGILSKVSQDKNYPEYLDVKYGISP